MIISLNDDIKFILSNKIHINEILDKIIYEKELLEKEEALKYHIKRWKNISSAYFYSFEYNISHEKLPYSYVLDGKKFIANKDRKLDFYNLTGISFQVRDLLMDILNCYNTYYDFFRYKNIEINDNIFNCTFFEWRKEDDKIYSILSKKIMDKFN
jgi:hypothetical protein